MIERQEIHCHNCDRYVQFNLDTEMEGRHVLHCPVCGHEHCRVVVGGRVTDERWDQRNQRRLPTYTVSAVSSTSSSTFTDYYLKVGTAATEYLFNAWGATGS